MPVRELPTPGKPQRLEARLIGTATDVAFHFVSPEGKPIRLLPLVRERESDESGPYAGEVTPPNAEYRLAVTGTDAKGFAFQRVENRYFLIPR